MGWHTLFLFYWTLFGICLSSGKVRKKIGKGFPLLCIFKIPPSQLVESISSSCVVKRCSNNKKNTQPVLIGGEYKLVFIILQHIQLHIKQLYQK